MTVDSSIPTSAGTEPTDRAPHAVSGGDIVRALRLPFCAAGALPYLAGAFVAVGSTRWDLFALGLAAVVLTHLSANLTNDVADDVNTVDRQDPRYFGFFGGSQLIQEGRLSRRAYLAGAVGCGAAAGVAVVLAAWLSGAWEAVGFFAAILLLGWSYSHPPLRLAGRGLGELVVFLLFGPACVVGGAYLQQGGWPGEAAWWVAVPMGLLTAAILVANEVPDAGVDAAGGKRTLVVRIGATRGWLLLAGVLAAVYASIVAGVSIGAIRPWGLASLGTIPLAGAVVDRVRRYRGPREAFVPVSKGVIVLQLIAAALLLLGVIR
ncbi:MAG: prenyltransferase [Planctomycetota bacterium]